MSASPFLSLTNKQMAMILQCIQTPTKHQQTDHKFGPRCISQHVQSKTEDNVLLHICFWKFGT